MRLLDAVGMEGPKAILALKRYLQALPGGARLEFWADRKVALHDVPSFCADHRHRLLMAREQDGHLVVVIEKSPELVA
ncbi:MAG: sulfurtransferase TusA family protein [Rhodothalassiaceae bacterium]